MDSSLIYISMIFLFENLDLDAAARGVPDPWTTYITDLIRYSWLMMTIRYKWNWIFFARPGLG